jgi:hypothetical protein
MRVQRKEKKLSRSRELAAKVIFAALKILKDRGGQAPGRDVIAEVEKRVTLDEWAKSTYPKSGYVRWQSILHFFSIDCIKAGYLVKKKGVWYLTPEGESKLKLGHIGLLDAATAAYRKWRNENQPPEAEEPEDLAEEGQQGQEAAIHEIEQLAIEGLQKDGDVGMFVSSGGFTSDATNAARGSHIHVELVDLERFISFWQEFYARLTDQDKTLLPLVPIYFYAPAI